MEEGEYVNRMMGSTHKADRRVLDLAAEYHDRCEGFDRTVCTGPVGKGGGITPATMFEHCLIERNARAVLQELTIKAAAMGIDAKELRRAIVDHISDGSKNDS